ncbi:MAG: hypothetical protein IPN59_00770 [Holophaga sp.]|nr:hypothetical protein [Holophaga sp.]
MARFKQWTWLVLVPAVLFVGCTVSVGGGPADTVDVTVRALYEKQDITSTGLGTLTTRPARYTFAELRDNSSDALLATVELASDGMGTAKVPRGSNLYAVIYADVLVPAAAGTSYALHGNVKKAIPKAHYATGLDLEKEPTWGTTSLSFLASSSGTLTVRALESTSEAGAFAIADQMVAFGQGMGRVEPTLPLPNLHAFWTSGTGSTYPTAATNSSGTLLRNPNTNRPMLVTEVWYGGPFNSADAFNDGLLLETFSRGLFATGSYWSTSLTNYGSVLRGDNDAAIISPWISSEPAIAFASGYATFLSAAIRDNPNVYLMGSTGTVDTWRLDQHEISPLVGGGEFYASSIARSQWGIWASVLGRGTAGLKTLWDATNPSIANQSYEFGNAPLACYPTYLVGLKRLAGASTWTAMQPQLDAENVGNGLDVTLSTYRDSTALWTTVAPSATPILGTLTTYDNSIPSNSNVYYDRVQAKAYRVVLGDGTHTVSVSTSSPAMIVEVFDHIGLLTAAYATTATPGSKTFTLAAGAGGTYVVRVRLDPFYQYTGALANYSLVIN